MAKKIELSSGYSTLVDDEDFESLSNFKWHYSAGYASRTDRTSGKARAVKMHRAIMGLSFGDVRVIDHINGDPLDNRKDNLRVCTNAENMRNQKLYANTVSGLKGVYRRRNGTWRAQIQVDGKRKCLGYFKTAEEGHQAYVVAAKELHGEFANTGESK